MKTPSTLRDREMADQLDRLVCGELEEASRRELVAWLEEDPLRWRLCGLAFLEAQTWSQTLGERKDSPQQSTEYPVLSTQHRESTRHWWPLVATLAACVLLSFGLGFSLRARYSSPPAADLAASSLPIMATLAVHASPDATETSQVQIPVVPSRSADEPIEAVPEYVRRKWERQGYQLSVERRYLFAKLTDGQQVVVPVEQIVVNQISPKVY